MAHDEEQRRELATFLRARRSQVDRSSRGLPPAPRARAGGLRREEVALLAGVSTTWYTWLEQARDINPSRQVIDAVATTLDLSPAEHDYVLRLAGFAPRPREAGQDAGELAHHQRLLDAQGDSPSFVLASDWAVVAWNAAYSELNPTIATLAPTQRNLLAMIFTEPAIRALLPDWEITSRRFLAEYRAETTNLVGREERADLVAGLRAASPEFAAAWADHGVERFASRIREFNHPARGRVAFEQHTLAALDSPGTRVVIYLPV